MIRPQISIKLAPTDYAGIANRTATVIASMTANSSFTTPSPSLASLEAQRVLVVNAIAVWSDEHNRGSHADLSDLRVKSLTLLNMLRSEANYVQGVSQTSAGNDYSAMAAIIESSGFSIKSAPNSQGVLEAVQNFHRFMSRSLYPNQVKLKWKKPLNVTSKNNVKDYRVLRGTTAVFSAAVEIATTTKAVFLDANTTGGTVTWYYWIVPVGTAGNGMMSEAVIVTLLSI